MCKKSPFLRYNLFNLHIAIPVEMLMYIIRLYQEMNFDGIMNAFYNFIGSDISFLLDRIKNDDLDLCDCDTGLIEWL